MQDTLSQKMLAKETPMTPGTPESSYLELAYSSIRIFANDGKLDLTELNFLLGLALKDGQVDDDEKRVLRRIFEQAEEAGVDPIVAGRIRAARRKHGL